MSFGKDVLVVKLEKHLDEGFVISRDSLSFDTNTRKQEKAEDIRSKYRNILTNLTIVATLMISCAVALLLFTVPKPDSIGGMCFACFTLTSLGNLVIVTLTTLLHLIYVETNSV